MGGEGMNKRTKKLAKWWCKFNVFEWPPDFPQPKPSNWDNADTDTRFRIMATMKIMNKIQIEIGLKECLREWNKTGLPGEKFDEWWNLRYPLTEK